MSEPGDGRRDWPNPTTSPSPFRVEPATPVPDDVVRPTPPEPERGSPASEISSGRTRGLVTVRRGPRPGTVLLGLLCLVMAAYVLVANLTTTPLSWRLVGPQLIGAVGGLLVLVGVIGVIVGRLRR